MKSRIFRAVVCFLLICCLVVNMSPIKAEAVLLETYLLYGVVASMVLMSAGVVFHAATDPQLQAMGKSFYNSMYQWGTEAQKLDEVEAFFNGLSIHETPDDDDVTTPNDHKIELARGILAGIMAWTCSILLDREKINAGEEAPEGYAYYNGYYLPIIEQSANPYMVCFMLSDGSINYFNKVFKLTIYTDYDGFYYFSCRASSGSKYTLIDGVWEYQYRYGDIAEKDGYLKDGAKIIWANYDVLYNDGSLYLAGSQPLTQEQAYLEAVAILSETAQGIKDGTLAEDALELPESIDYSELYEHGSTIQEAISNVAQGMQTGDITFDDYKSMIGYVPAVQPDPIDPSEDPDPTEESNPAIDPVPDPSVDVGDITVPIGEVSGSTFFQKLLDVVTAPFKWIWGKIESFFEPLLNPDFRLAPFEWIWGKIEPIPGQITQAVSDAAAEVKEAVQSLVVPDEDYLTDKVNTLCAEFAFADSIVRTGQALHLGLAGVTTEPPVIYIDLGASRGSYNIGGTVPFLDLRWYAEYKPTVDLIISAFLWACFAWRMLIKLPGIISGMPGDFVAYSAHAIGINSQLPSRSLEYEMQRKEIRDSLRRGKDG